MKKSDLKTGMWVETRKGNKYIYLEGCETERHGVQDIFVDTDEEGFALAEDYNTDLKNSCYEVFDIVKIYWDEECKVNGSSLIDCPPLYWERQEKTYLDDLLEKFPNIETDPDGSPVKHICLRELYLHRHFNCEAYDCYRENERSSCWDQPLGSLARKDNDE